MASGRGFLNLPRELRDKIYQLYLELEGGYVYSVESGRLRTPSGKPISLDLMYTCRLINEEMKGLALRSNKITFATFFSEDLDVRARRLQGGMMMASCEKTFLLLFTLYFGPPSVATDIMEKVGCKYPQFGKFLEEICAGRYIHAPQFAYKRFGDPNNWRHSDWGIAMEICWGYDRYTEFNYSGLVPSTYRDAVDHAFALAAERFPYTEYESRYDKEKYPLPDIKLLASTACDPWANPTEEKIRQVGDSIERGSSRRERAGLVADDLPHRFSAAAAAIQFLHSISKENRLLIRSIVLLENRLAFPHQECHAQGLIPLCQENQLLRVERRVDLWWVVFQPNPRGVGAWIQYATRKLSHWISEAFALIPQGMPPFAFSLVLDGEPDPQLCSDIFQRVILRDAAWQAALDECCARGHIGSMEFIQRRWMHSYVSEDFPEAMNHVVEGKSALVCCNFDLGVPLNTEHVIDEHIGWTIDDWESQHKEYEAHDICSTPHMLEMYKLREHEFLPIDWYKKWQQGLRE